MGKHLPIFVSIAALITFLMIQQSNAACEDALVLATYIENTTFHSDWRLAKYVSDTVSNTVRNEKGANAVIYGVPVGANNTEFKENYRKMEQSYNESLTLNQTQNILWTGLDPQVTGIYSKCIEHEIYNAFGLHIAVIGATSQSYLITVSWHPTPPSLDLIKVEWEPEKIGDTTLKTDFPSGRKSISVPRPSSEINLVASYKGDQSERITLLPIPTPLPRLTTCLEYRVKGANEDFAACNAKTSDGYFWKVLKPRIGVYHEGGVTPTGLPECGPGSVGKTGFTARYPTWHAFFEDVGNSLVEAGTAHSDGFDCAWTSSDYRLKCGKFNAVCTKQP